KDPTKYFKSKSTYPPHRSKKPPRRKTTEERTNFASADWSLQVQEIGSFEELLSNRKWLKNELGILGKVENLTSESTRDGPYTTYKVRILRLIKDESHSLRVGDTVKVSQFGGLTPAPSDSPYDYVKLEFADCPLMKKGSISILFLSDHENSGVYGGISPWTRFPVGNEKVYWLGAAYENRPIEIQEAELERAENGLITGIKGGKDNIPLEDVEEVDLKNLIIKLEKAQANLGENIQENFPGFSNRK
ncbi:hypothetical protein AKJ57_06870, partial [candidate division MSBL1 archaeon SCGC-AAA259A05]